MPPSRSRARASTARTSSTRAETAESSSNAAADASATIRAIVVLPTPGGPWRIIEGARPSAIARRSAVPGPRTLVWPTSSSRVRGRTLCGSGATVCARVAAASLNRSLTRPVCSPRCPRRVRTTTPRSSRGTPRATTSDTSGRTSSWRCRRGRRSGCTATSSCSRSSTSRRSSG